MDAMQYLTVTMAEPTRFFTIVSQMKDAKTTNACV